MQHDQQVRELADGSTVTLHVAYAQVALFDGQLEDPFNDWTPAHLAQGFAWRPGSVSFSTMESEGAIELTLHWSREVAHTLPAADRIIIVPFTVPSHGDVHLATIVDTVALRIPPGEYALRFEHGVPAEGAMWARLALRPVKAPVAPVIELADPLLSPPETLLMIADPA